MGSLERRRLVLPEARTPTRVGSPSDLWRLFLSDKAAQTQVNYTQDLECFRKFWGAESIPDALRLLLKCSAQEANATVVDYQGYLRSARFYRPGDDPETARPVQVGYAPRTVNRRLIAVKSVVTLANLLGVIDWTIAVKIRRADNTRNTTGCGPEGYGAILVALQQAAQEAREKNDLRQLELALRDHVLIRLLHDSGMRRNETILVEWPLGVMLDTTARDGAKYSQVLTRRKGNTQSSWVPISDECGVAVRAYLNIRGKDAGYLLCTTHPAYRGEGLTASTVNRRVAHWSALAGASTTPHGLRHTGATTLLDLTNGDRRQVMAWSGHRSVESLQPYDDARRDHARLLTQMLADPSKARPHDR